jgi:hypothetical protein
MVKENGERKVGVTAVLFFMCHPVTPTRKEKKLGKGAVKSTALLPPSRRGEGVP